MVWKKRIVLLGFVGHSALLGVTASLSTVWENAEWIVLVLGLLTSLLALFWCHYDSLERNYTLRRPLIFTIALVWFVGLPIYLFRTRGVRGFRSLLWVSLFFLALCFIVGVSAMMTALFLGLPI